MPSTSIHAIRTSSARSTGEPWGSDVEVLHVEGIFFDEFAALLDIFAHERGKDRLGLDHVLELHLQQSMGLGLHGGGPDLIGVHFTQALGSRDKEVFRV